MKNTLFSLVLVAGTLQFAECSTTEVNTRVGACFGYELIQTQLEGLQNQLMQLIEKLNNKNPSNVSFQSNTNLGIPTGCVKIFNEYFSKYISTSSSLDEYRRKIMLSAEAEEWYLVPEANFYRITRKKRREDLYAAMNDRAFDSQRRQVFTWIPGCDEIQSQWEVTRAPGFEGMVHIRSVFFGEYLYADVFDNNIFTWRSKNNPRNKLLYIWKIEQC